MEDRIRAFKTKILEKKVTVDDLDEFLEVFVLVARSSIDMSAEIEDLELTVAFKVNDGKWEAGVDVRDGEVTALKHGSVPKSAVKVVGDSKTIIEFLCGKKAIGEAVMAGSLAVEGNLADASRFGAMIDIFRDAIQL